MGECGSVQRLDCTRHEEELVGLKKGEVGQCTGQQGGGQIHGWSRLATVTDQEPLAD